MKKFISTRQKHAYTKQDNYNSRLVTIFLKLLIFLNFAKWVTSAPIDSAPKFIELASKQRNQLGFKVRNPIGNNGQETGDIDVDGAIDCTPKGLCSITATTLHPLDKTRSKQIGPLTYQHQINPTDHPAKLVIEHDRVALYTQPSNEAQDETPNALLTIRRSGFNYSIPFVDNQIYSNTVTFSSPSHAFRTNFVSSIDQMISKYRLVFVGERHDNTLSIEIQGLLHAIALDEESPKIKLFTEFENLAPGVVHIDPKTAISRLQLLIIHGLKHFPPNETLLKHIKTHIKDAREAFPEFSFGAARKTSNNPTRDTLNNALQETIRYRSKLWVSTISSFLNKNPEHVAILHCGAGHIKDLLTDLSGFKHHTPESLQMLRNHQEKQYCSDETRCSNPDILTKDDGAIRLPSKIEHIDGFTIAYSNHT